MVGHTVSIVRKGEERRWEGNGLRDAVNSKGWEECATERIFTHS